MATEFDTYYINRLLERDYPPVVEEPVMLAMGGAGAGPKPTTMKDIGELGGAMADVGAATVKGAAQSFVGTPGDIESLYYGVREIVRRKADESVLDAFIKGMDQKTIAPTTEEVKAWLDKNIGAVQDGEHPYESVGEVMAPGGYIAGAKKGLKSIKKAKKIVTGTAAGGAATSVSEAESKNSETK